MDWLRKPHLIIIVIYCLTLTSQLSGERRQNKQEYCSPSYSWVQEHKSWEGMMALCLDFCWCDLLWILQLSSFSWHLFVCQRWIVLDPARHSLPTTHPVAHLVVEGGQQLHRQECHEPIYSAGPLHKNSPDILDRSLCLCKMILYHVCLCRKRGFQT